MSTPILATKFFIPPPRPKAVLRPRLIERLNNGLHGTPGMTIVSAPAGFGKTLLVSEWVASCNRPVAWLSLDEGDNDPIRFLTYLVSALQTLALRTPRRGGKTEGITANFGKGTLGMLQSRQPPPTESILTALLNEITTIPENFILVLDDYHLVDEKPVDNAVTFLLDHLPPQMHLVITTREDPNLPLPRLRARDKLTELRVTDLRFSPSETAEFLNQVMGLNLTTEDIAALETRTEGWVAGLQLAGIALQGSILMHGQKDTSSFIKSFTGSHRLVTDYLVQEVLQQQSESVQTFLLRTSILDRMCGPLCDAVLGAPFASGQETLEYLESANLFIVPLDDEQRWYRYHHLFSDLLRQRLSHGIASSADEAEGHINELHIRASQWYEDNGLDMEAFHHAAAGNDIGRAERLIEGKGIPLHFRGAVTAMLEWLESLPTIVLNDRPSLWWTYASLLLVNGQTAGVEEKLQAAEAGLKGIETDNKTRNLIGQIATARATLALTHYDLESVVIQSRRALEYLPPDNLSYRATANVMLGHAYIFQGDRAVARRVLTEAITLSEASGDIFTTMLATIALGQVEETENQFYLAAETYQRVLQLAGEQPLQMISEAHRGLARILYEWNDLDAAEQYGQQSLYLARQYDGIIDRYIISEVFLARLKLAQGDVPGAAAILAEAEQSARQRNFVHRIPEIAAVQVLTLLQQGDLAAAADLAQTHELPISRARVHLAQGDTSAALAILEPFCQQMEAKGWVDEQLKVLVLLAIVFHVYGEKDKALQLLDDALTLAKPGGFIRIFVDEGTTMAELLTRVNASREGGRSALSKAEGMKEYIRKLLDAFGKEKNVQPSAEPLSQRELEVLHLIAQGLSNDEISKQLFLALDTVKGHNRRIFEKLRVQRRTEAVARARELGLL